MIPSILYGQQVDCFIYYLIIQYKGEIDDLIS
jgi:hypothetical protein